MRPRWLGEPAPTRIGRPVLVGVLVALIGAGVVARGTAIGGNRRVSTDERGNASNANSILTHSPYAVLRWAPGTPFVFAVATRLGGGGRVDTYAHAHGPAQYANLLLETGTLILVAVVSWSLAGPYAALLAVAFAGLYLPLILITRTYLSEPLGGLLILATFAAAAFARRRSTGWLVAAGILAGLACLAREDLVPGVMVIAVALAGPLWRASPLQAIRRGAVYSLAAAVVIVPWLFYASGRDGRFVPITDGGPTALFIGTYLPGDGELQFVLRAFKGPVCRRYPQYCHHYEQYGSEPMFELVSARYPHLSRNAAVTRAALDNLRRYALGDPGAFAGMLLHKVWIMWGTPWGGGNTRPDTSRTQHLFFVGVAWLGLLGGAVATRRWSLITVTAGLILITALNVLVNAQGRDNLRLLPLLFAFGLAGFSLVGRGAWAAVRRPTGRRRRAGPALGRRRAVRSERFAAFEPMQRIDSASEDSPSPGDA